MEQRRPGQRQRAARHDAQHRGLPPEEQRRHRGAGHEASHRESGSQYIYRRSTRNTRFLTRLVPQVHHAYDSFLALTTDGINFLLSDQEICDVVSQCHNPTEAADVIAQQVMTP